MHGIHARLAVIGQLPRQSKGSRSRVLLQDLFDAPHDRREELPEPRRRARPPGAGGGGAVRPELRVLPASRPPGLRPGLCPPPSLRAPLGEPHSGRLRARLGPRVRDARAADRPVVDVEDLVQIRRRGRRRDGRRVREEEQDVGALLL